MFVWGDNYFGQLGLGHRVGRSSPIKLTLPNGAKVSNIAMGTAHVLVKANDGYLYVWGRNMNGELGLGTKTDVLKPESLKLPGSYWPTQVYSYGNSSFCINSSGEIYSWGRNVDGQLGLGNKIDQLKPTKITIPNSKKIKYFFVSYDFAGFLSVDDEIYTWGTNGCGQLGNGTIMESLTPTKIELP